MVKRASVVADPVWTDGLEQLLGQCPGILEALEPNCLKALIATSRNLRKQVYNFVTGMELVAKTDEGPMGGLCISPYLPHVYSLELRCKLAPTDTERLVASSLPGLHNFSLDTQKLDETCAAHLGRGNWPQLRHLVLWVGQIDVPVLQHLARGKWRKLDEFRVFIDWDANQCWDDDEMWSEDPLVGADWPRLRSLQLTQQQYVPHLLSSEQTARWGCLQDLHVNNLLHEPEMCLTALRSLELGFLHHVSSLDALLGMQLPALQSLAITHPLISVNEGDRLALLAVKDWPLLEYFALTGHMLDLSLAPLVQCTWPLTWVELRHSMLDAAAMRHLVACRLPCLVSLDLGATNLDSEKMVPIGRAHWPALRSLYLDNNLLEAKAMSVLVMADFPLLQDLKLYCCQLDPLAFCVLLQGQWPRLKDFDVSENPDLTCAQVGAICNEQNTLRRCQFGKLQQAWLDQVTKARADGTVEYVGSLWIR